jgi:hypothetical protein
MPFLWFLFVRFGILQETPKKYQEIEAMAQSK